MISSRNGHRFTRIDTTPFRLLTCEFFVKQTLASLIVSTPNEGWETIGLSYSMVMERIGGNVEGSSISTLVQVPFGNSTIICQSMSGNS